MIIRQQNLKKTALQKQQGKTCLQKYTGLFLPKERI